MNKKLVLMFALIISVFLVMGSASAGFFDFLDGENGRAESGAN